MSLLELDSVTKSYPGSPPVHALREVSVVIDDSEFVAIVGPSGSGKTTLLSIAGTLERPSTGGVNLAGMPVDALPDAELSRFRSEHVGFVFQQFFLLPSLSAAENVATALIYRGVARSERREAAEAALETVGLSMRGGHRPSQLSGGECQRVAIARALVGSPRILFADEPTGNLDSVTGGEILALLERVNSAGTTVIVVTHSLVVAKAARRVVSVFDGAVASDSRGAP